MVVVVCVPLPHTIASFHPSNGPVLQNHSTSSFRVIVVLRRLAGSLKLRTVPDNTTQHNNNDKADTKVSTKGEQAMKTIQVM